VDLVGVPAALEDLEVQVVSLLEDLTALTNLVVQ
jgi:hypothetical protein